ncbi:MAG: hypothetical protein Crog4KO_36800 [Crocinitomicaceae bacterium]
MLQTCINDGTEVGIDDNKVNGKSSNDVKVNNETVVEVAHQHTRENLSSEDAVEALCVIPAGIKRAIKNSCYLEYIWGYPSEFILTAASTASRFRRSN